MWKCNLSYFPAYIQHKIYNTFIRNILIVFLINSFILMFRGDLMVKVSILMPVYNLEDYIEHAMESIFKQTLKDIEIICVNDGSVDGSLEVLREFESKYNFIKVFSQENKGAGPALNKCIEEASGEYIAFLDADDIYVDDDALEKMYEYGVENDAEIVAGNLKFVEGTNYRIVDADHYKRKLYRLSTKKETIHPSRYGIPYAFYKNIFKREFIMNNNIRFPPFKRGVDTLFLARALVNATEIHTIPVWLYGYNHAVGGGFNKKLSDYDFIKNFFIVFRSVFDVLDDAGFYNVTFEFKKELFLYLNFAENAKDFEIYKLVLEVFGKDGHYFNEDYEEEYNLFVANEYINRLEANPNNDILKETKEKILELNLINNSLVSAHLLKKAFIILKSNSIEEYNRAQLELKITELERKNKKLTKKNKSLKQENAKFKKKFKKIDRKYKSILSSNSWKLTKPLRALKRIFR